MRLSATDNNFAYLPNRQFGVILIENFDIYIIYRFAGKLEEGVSEKIPFLQTPKSIRAGVDRRKEQ